METRRLVTLCHAQNKLAEDLQNVGYPDKDEKQYESLMSAYENLNKAFDKIIVEEARIIALSHNSDSKEDEVLSVQELVTAATNNRVMHINVQFPLVRDQTFDRVPEICCKSK